MDLSRPSSDYLPKGSGGTGARLWKAVMLLVLSIFAAAAIGTLGFLGLRQLAPIEPYVGVIVGLIALVAVLRWISQRFSWIMPWYYLLPAILFLATFTLFPVVLTVVLAFTDYAGIRNGQLNPGSRTDIVAVDAQGLNLELSDIASLNCQAARNNCLGIRARVEAAGSLEVTGVALEENVLTVAEDLSDAVGVTGVSLELLDIGFRAEFPVTEVVGNTLVLARTPPGAVNLETVEVQVASEVFERQITAIDGNTVTLNEALPEGVEPTSILRYNDFGFVGWANFRTILRRATSSLWPVFVWNLLFAVSTVLINTAFGVFIAVLLNNPDLKFRNLYRTLLIIPWALPNIVTIQVWRGFLNSNFGAINRALALLDLPVLDWLNEVWAARAAVLLVNLWLGLPFMMTATLGALSAIPNDLYEAAKIDGAGPLQRFSGVTFPLLRTALVPITLTSFAFNFNNFNIIYLLTDGGPAYEGGISTARGTDILISWAYNEAFRSQGGYAYGLGSAISLLIFFITIAISLINFRVTGALKETSNT
jgi:arabinogalactan oligomer/maltooligosaccharide transport system permease protein